MAGKQEGKQEAGKHEKGYGKGQGKYQEKNACLRFSDLSFEQVGDRLIVRLLKLFEFSIPMADLRRLGDFSIDRSDASGTSGGSLSFRDVSQEKAEREFSRLIAKNIGSLKNNLTGRKAVYIHRTSGIPLMGTLYFGIVDKGSDMMEVKPITGCNLSCIFCSVGEGIGSKKEVDYVVEDDYLIEELEKILQFKKHEGMKIFINPHGEPLLYANIVQLVGRISRLEHVGSVSMITNGIMLSEQFIDELADAGLTGINLSINSLDASKARQLSGIGSYDAGRMKMLAEHAAKRLKLTIAPVWMKGVNDDDIEELIRFAKKLGCGIGIQKFIAHRSGKKAAKEIAWDDFYRQISLWEEKYGVNLRYCSEIVKTKELPMPFREGDRVKARVVCDGRRKDEAIAAADGRSIAVFGCGRKPRETMKIRILTAKHNIFTAEEI